MDIEDSIPALASAIISVYDIRKNIVNNELKGRDLKHVEYGIMKELENVWNIQKRLFQLNNRTQKRYKQIKPIYLQKHMKGILTRYFSNSSLTINLNK
jgi:hypothetical protein